MRAVQRIWIVCLLGLCGCSDEQQPDSENSSVNTDQSSVVAPNPDSKQDDDSKSEPPTDEDAASDSVTSSEPIEPLPEPISRLDVSYIPENAVVAVYIHPQRIANAPAIQPLVDDPFVCDQLLPTMFQFGFHPLDVEQLVVTLSAPLPNALFGFSDEQQPAEDPVSEPLDDVTEPLEADDDDPGHCQIDEPPPIEAAGEIEPALELTAPDKDEPDFRNLFEGLEPAKPIKDDDGNGFEPEPKPLEPEFPPVFIPNNMGVVVRFVDAGPAKSFAGGLQDRMVETTFDGKTYWRQDVFLEPHAGDDGEPADPIDVGLMAIFIADERTVVFAEHEMLLRMLIAEDSDSRLLRRLKTLDAKRDIIAAADADRLADDELFAAITAGLSDPDLQTGLNALQSFSISLDLTHDTLIEAVAKAASAEDAVKLEAALRDGLSQCKTLAAQSLETELPPADALPLEFAKSLLEASDVTRDGETLRFSVKRPDLLDDLPEVLDPVLENVKAGARHAQRLNNLQQLAVAMGEYSVFQEQLTGKPAFPPAWLADTEGKPLLSWRVMLLPFLGEAETALYQRFHRDEPWDSAHNLKLLGEMPAVFGEGGETNVMLFTGEGTAFVGVKAPAPFEITDGTANTILLIYAAGKKQVPWTKPEDLRFDSDDPLASLGKIPDAGIDVAMFDFQVLTLPNTIDAATLRTLVDPSDGETTDDDLSLPP